MSTTKFIMRTRGALASVVLLGALIVSLGVAVPSSSAGTSKFCTTLFTYETKYASKATPPTSFKNYKSWAKELLPFYETLASEAPDQAAKTVLNEVVAILKYESTQSSITKLTQYVAANSKKFAASEKTLAKDIEACA
ncbi:MAG: hypothetical protein WA359_05375 [Acidimicrobiales bacterium]